MSKYIVEVILKSSSSPFKKMHTEVVSFEHEESAKHYGWVKARELAFPLDLVEVRVHECTY